MSSSGSTFLLVKYSTCSKFTIWERNLNSTFGIIFAALRIHTPVSCIHTTMTYCGTHGVISDKIENNDKDWIKLKCKELPFQQWKV